MMIKWTPYKVIILPDDLIVSEKLKERLEKYLGDWGKISLTGRSGLNSEGKDFVFDIAANAKFAGESPFCPDYILPEPMFRPDFVDSPFIMYLKSQRIKVQERMSLGKIFDPYFNRTLRHFCLHQHVPPKLSPSGFDCEVRKEDI